MLFRSYEHPEVDFMDMAMRFMDIRKRIYTFPKMGEKAYFIAIPTSSGTGSAQGLGCSPIKAVRELGSERRETVRSLSGVGVRYLRGAVLSTRGPGWTGRWCICCLTKGIAE